MLKISALYMLYVKISDLRLQLLLSGVSELSVNIAATQEVVSG